MCALDFHRGGLNSPQGQGNPHLLQNEERKTQVPCETAKREELVTWRGAAGSLLAVFLGRGICTAGRGSRAMNKVAVCWEHLRDSGHFVHFAKSHRTPAAGSLVPAGPFSPGVGSPRSGQGCTGPAVPGLARTC